MMNTSLSKRVGVAALICLFSRAPAAAAGWEGTVASAPEGWKVSSPRDEIRPEFAYDPRGGKTAADNCRQFAPLIAEAAKQKADLVVLGECVTIVGNGVKVEQAAEAVPGPSTAYFGQLAKQHNL